MEFTGDTIKNGQSVVGDFRLDYSISYNSENKVTRFDAQVKKVSETMVRSVGNISFVESNKRYSFSLMETSTSEERTALFDDFENTLAELS